ncbi:unnamed protein product [Sphagnum jensenii]|uniref:Uncharacterized protein n=1 Tax=Sphagnum jensenii TaxID=128206 RepID=A0ABP0VRL5_9BRYO
MGSLPCFSKWRFIKYARSGTLCRRVVFCPAFWSVGNGTRFCVLRVEICQQSVFMRWNRGRSCESMPAIILCFVPTNFMQSCADLSSIICADLLYLGGERCRCESSNKAWQSADGKTKRNCLHQQFGADSPHLHLMFVGWLLRRHGGCRPVLQTLLKLFQSHS